MTERVEVVAVDDGCRLWTATTGVGAPLVLCHGGPGLWDYLSPVAAMLDDSYTVHRWDQRGSGRSSVTPPYSIERFVADLDALRSHFGYECWIVGGHSWGASLALHYALAHPRRTRALVYISGTGIGHGWRHRSQDERTRRLRADGAERRWRDLDSRERTDAEERELCILTWMTDYADMALGRAAAEAMLADGYLPNYVVNRALSARALDEARMIERCRGLAVPILIVHGDADPRPTWALDSLVAALPDVTRVVIEGAGHAVWDEAPEAFRDSLRSFLASLSETA